jgi:hypothetical protein
MTYAISVWQVWDVQDYTCLHTLSRQVHMVRGPLLGVAFNHLTQIIALAGDQLGIIKVQG